MLSRLVSLRNGIIFAASLSLSVMGCGSRSTGLPESVTLELPDGTTVEADQGDGAPSLANSQWEFFRSSSSAQSMSGLVKRCRRDLKKPAMTKE